MIDIAHAGPALAASFLASLVECVEALTIVLAVGAVRGWRPALAGAGLAVSMLVLLVVVFGSGLRLVPLPLLQTAIGVLLLLFGMRWLRKAILRAGGVIARRDEAVNYTSEVRLLRTAASAGGWDLVGIATSFKAVALEGIEVVFIVIAVGAAGGALGAATAGALAAAALVAAIGFLLHRPLAQVPENALKFAVGIMLSSFGTFWLGEGYGAQWPAGDLSLLGLVAGYLAAAALAVWAVRHIRQRDVLPRTS